MSLYIVSAANWKALICVMSGGSQHSHQLYFFSLVNIYYAPYNCIEGTVINCVLFHYLFSCESVFVIDCRKMKYDLFICLIDDNSEELYVGARLNLRTVTILMQYVMNNFVFGDQIN